MTEVTMDKIVSLAKRRGFIYPGSEIYGGLSGTWDYGPLGVELKNNIKNLWWRIFVQDRDDMLGLDAAIVMNPDAWRASGHVAGFADPLENGKMFNTMFTTSVGTGVDAITVYLRPETAGGIFVNFKNVVDSFHPKLPFGIAQIGKAFRNEIAPRDFVFRSREFEQLEIEYFVRPTEWEKAFGEWQKNQIIFAETIGLALSHIKQVEVSPEDRAHYSKQSVDTEFVYPFGQKELWGLAYRTDYDLAAHAEASGVDLSYLDEITGERFIPHVVEPSFGIDRTVLALLVSAYAEDALGGEARTYLKFNSAVAPVKAAVFPLLKNKPELVAKAREVYGMLKKDIPQIMWDDNGNIGKRYRRQDEIGTPYCITIDFDTLGDPSTGSGQGSSLKDTITIRNRDTGEQERVSINSLASRIA
ncbi:glycine--tRNA ligase [Candidatus Kaiserbacteria bacterium]|nr:glycine--tRNA ligase [Candidatus Kaiserbacteria bacterium]